MDDAQRELLVKTVHEGGISIRKAAIKLGINYSTAKHIMRTTEGTISTTPTDKKPKKAKQGEPSSEGLSDESEDDIPKKKPLLGEKRKVTFIDENDSTIVHQTGEDSNLDKGGKRHKPDKLVPPVKSYAVK